MDIMSVIDDYLQGISPPQRTELERIRAIAREMLPESEEVISYAMPAIKYKGKPIIGFAARKNHIGIYPFSGKVIMCQKTAAFRPGLNGSLE